MSLSEIMSRAGLALYPIVALVLFVAVFASVLIRVMRLPRDTSAAFASMALDEAEPAVAEAAVGCSGGGVCRNACLECPGRVEVRIDGEASAAS